MMSEKEEKGTRSTTDPLETSWLKDDRRPNPFGMLVEAALKPKLRKFLLSAARGAARAGELGGQGEIVRAERERSTPAPQATGEPSSKAPAGPATGARAVAKPLRKLQDISEHLNGAGLTGRQQECLSLRLEYGLSVTEIARRLDITRKTVDEHINAGKKRIDRARLIEKTRKATAKVKPSRFDGN